MKNIITLTAFIISLHINVWSQRQYYTNRTISGSTEDAQGINYLLLHTIYVGSPLADSYVMGKITGVRGNTGSWNRKWTVEVNTASAYTSNRGSIISYNEGTRLVTLTYNGEKYLAIEIANGAMLYDFSFTGYASNETLTIVYDQDISDVQDFTSLDPITISTDLEVVGNATLGNSTANTYSKLVIKGPNVPENMDSKRDISFEFASAGKAQIRSYRGGSWDTYLQFLTSSYSNTGGEPSVRMHIDGNGNVLIGKTTQTNTAYKLDVAGKIRADEIVVNTTGADFVFAPNYKLRSLAEVEAFIKQYKHLPDIAPAGEMQTNGVSMGEMQAKLLQKLEETTLYLIEMQKQYCALIEENKALKQEIDTIRKSMEQTLNK